MTSASTNKSYELVEADFYLKQLELQPDAAVHNKPVIA